MDIFAIASSGFAAVYDYMMAHTLVCLVSAFFHSRCHGSAYTQEPAPALPRDRLPQAFSYLLSVASDLLLAVCSCTVLPLFAGIKKCSAGIGPAITFLQRTSWLC
jgi:uncharacterized membrane protein YraQ (UPF0718 family)